MASFEANCATITRLSETAFILLTALGVGFGACTSDEEEMCCFFFVILAVFKVKAF